jgi:hypothetical protein
MTMTINGTSGLVFNDASTQNTAATGFGFKNRIINGNMTISQRNGTSSVTPSDGTYCLDRWRAGASASSKFSVQQSSVAPAGFSFSMLVTSLSAYSVGTNDNFEMFQLIEGFNTADLAWGTASAQSITISFWVRSSLTGTFGGSVQNSAFNRSYPFTYTISAANTWEQKSVTVAGDTSGTWIGATNGTGLVLCIGLGAGSGRSGTAGAWASSTFYNATGATSVVGTNGATFYITGVQLEKGSTATSFDYRPYGTEMVLCQRYFARMNALSNYTGFATGLFDGGTTGAVVIKYPTTMRAAPTFSYSTLAVYDGSGVYAVSGLRTTYAGTDSMNQDISVASGGTVNRVINLVANNSTSAYVAFSAEL